MGGCGRGPGSRKTKDHRAGKAGGKGNDKIIITGKT
jgi:hypothetical protein